MRLALLAGCGGDGEQAADGPVELSFWAWAPNIDKVVDKWNATHPDANDVLAGISEGAASAKDKFAPGSWEQVTLGGSGVYGVPQDSGPMMFYYRADLFEQYGLKAPTTWEEYAQTARDLRAKAPDKFLGTFSSNDPGWLAGLVQQAGGSWWAIDGDTWKVSVDDTATKKVAQSWSGLVAEGAADKTPMYTPEWNTALNDGTQIGWLSAVWAPGALQGNAESTLGKWAMAPMPQWDASSPRTGNWGGSTTAVTAGSKKQKAATEFAIWFNTDPTAVGALVTESAIYPAATSGQEAVSKPPAFFPNQPDFYTQAAKIAATSSGFTWGPNVNVTYTAYKNAMGEAITAGADLAPALTKMQTATVDDMKANGFTVGG